MLSAVMAKSVCHVQFKVLHTSINIQLLEKNVSAFCKSGRFFTKVVSKFNITIFDLEIWQKNITDGIVFKMYKY